MISKINKYSDTFKGVTTLNNKDYEIPFTIKDEVIDCFVNKNGEIKLNKIIESSPFRVNPKCPIFEKCGGCSLQHIEYTEQLKIKHDIVKELFDTTFKKDYFVSDTIGMNNPYYYRNKNQYVYKNDKFNKVICGLYEEGTHNVINYDKCMISNKLANEIASYIKDIMIRNHFYAYDEDKKTGLIRHVVIKTSEYTKEVMVVIVTGNKMFPGSQNFVKDLLDKFPMITTIIHNVNDKKTSQVLGSQEKVLYGKGYIVDKLLGKTFKIASKSFYQINHLQCEKLYSKAIELAGLNKSDTLLDTYCGVGTIGLIASDKVKQVIGVELVKDAIEAAIDNAKHNNVKNIRFYCDDASKFMKKLSEKKEHVDCVIMDPPRKGSDKIFLDSVLLLKPKKIVYISCNPFTQVVDLKQLLKAYKITHIQPVDMFPHSKHIENIVELCLK